jgi:hypothetical protein
VRWTGPKETFPKVRLLRAVANSAERELVKTYWELTALEGWIYTLVEFGRLPVGTKAEFDAAVKLRSVLKRHDDAQRWFHGSWFDWLCEQTDEDVDCLYENIAPYVRLPWDLEKLNASLDEIITRYRRRHAGARRRA